MKWKLFATGLLLTVLGVSAAAAQTCEAVGAPLEALAAACTDLSRAFLCQNGQVTSLDGVPGFTVDGFALSETQANYPDVDAGQFVNAAFVGALDVRPVVDISLAGLPERIPVDVNIKTGKLNVRAGAGRVGAAVAQLDNGTQLSATGISRDTSWIRVQLPDQPTQPAWVTRGYLLTDYDITKLPVVSTKDPIPQYPRFTPLQAFSFTSGSPCAGVVLQSGDNLARMQVNGVALEFHSATAFLQNTGSTLDINVLEGYIQVQTQSVTTIGPPGTIVRVPLDPAGQPSAAPPAPVPYDAAQMDRLAGKYAQRAVAAAPAADGDAIQAALVTPLSGFWKVVYPPPYEYKSVEGPQCGSLKIKGGGDQIFDITVSDDGSSFSAYNPTIAIGAGVRVHPGLYELRDFSFQVLSPTEMTATYDTNPLAACTSIITITAQWMRPEK